MPGFIPVGQRRQALGIDVKRRNDPVMVEGRARPHLHGVLHAYFPGQPGASGVPSTHSVPVLDARNTCRHCGHRHPGAVKGAVVIELKGNLPARIAHLGQRPAHLIAYRKFLVAAGMQGTVDFNADQHVRQSTR